jgi:hypothetical protein
MRRPPPAADRNIPVASIGDAPRPVAGHFRFLPFVAC